MMTTRFDIEVESYGSGEGDQTYCVLQNGHEVAGPFGSKQEAQTWIDANKGEAA